MVRRTACIILRVSSTCLCSIARPWKLVREIARIDDCMASCSTRSA